MKSTVRTARSLLLAAAAAGLLAACQGMPGPYNMAGTAAGGFGGGMLANSLTKDSQWNKYAIGAGSVLGAAIGRDMGNRLDNAGSGQQPVMQPTMPMMPAQMPMQMPMGRDVYLTTNPAMMPQQGYQPVPQCQRVMTQMGPAFACPRPDGTWQMLPG